jgi:predicted ester cyclase
MTTDNTRRALRHRVAERASLEAIRHPRIAYHWGSLGDGDGREGLIAQEERARAAFPDITVVPSFTVADDRFVVNRSIVKGTHQGTWFGLAPTGNRATWSAIEIYRIADRPLGVPLSQQRSRRDQRAP